MFIAISKYKKPLAEVDVYRAEHHQYVKSLFAAGKLLVCGRQNPPVGGVIIAITQTLAEFEIILENDPFTKADVAEYNIIEVKPSFYDDCLAPLLIP